VVVVGARPAAPFAHPAPAGGVVLDAGAACHRLAAGGEPRSTGHGACTACHAEHFVAPRPGICGACHASTEPWRALTVDRMPSPTSDFGASLDHGRHRALACERCHSLDTAARELRPPRGHVACSGSGCHAASGGPPPALAACAACHGLGVERTRTAERTAAPWSVRTRFRHGGHRVDRAGVALPCGSCHSATTAAGDGAMPAPPAKVTCAPCHDGKIAFKMSGHGCARCHGD
jgi:c(7)-type cytochrome triheme protein